MDQSFGFWSPNVIWWPGSQLDCKHLPPTPRRPFEFFWTTKFQFFVFNFMIWHALLFVENMALICTILFLKIKLFHFSRARGLFRIFFTSSRKMLEMNFFIYNNMVLFTCFDLDFHYRPWKFSTGKPYPKIWKNYRPALLKRSHEPGFCLVPVPISRVVTRQLYNKSCNQF